LWQQITEVLLLRQQNETQICAFCGEISNDYDFELQKLQAK